MFGIFVEVQGRPAGLHSRTEPRGEDEKGAMAGTRVEPSKTSDKWCWFCQTSSRNNPTMEKCLLHAQWSDFWSAISVTRVAEIGVHD